MHKYMLMGMLTISIAVTGCQEQNNVTEEDGQALHQNGNTINVSETNDMYNQDKKKNNRYGYVRHQKSPVANENQMAQNISTFDREQAADSISRLSTATPNVNDVAVLVTDEEVLIVYKTDTQNRSETADQVKRTAMSVVPRYYHVYVSDNPSHMADIERFSQVDIRDKNIQSSINQTIKEMLQSPQGRKMTDGENANGEGKNELNEPMTDDTDKASTRKNIME
ncbi:YhcN/YlaJ family sporulation lipoprotein [Bacillus sp. CGMCC 1.16541]|uniref:YhcN/YlaJ family sporulation lipoprotein n=1 Tax=Bacillus sp. CGMCC 1.16541 TaxID=2185143 RepID=UPI000D72762A|nr:YhcN/YlaJ family sporulation lipoprotein [Bacillus sp. CGMCC 1.16541]